MSFDWATDPGSISVFGKTQTGKTALARQIHSESPRISVWVNDKDALVKNIPGKRVSGIDGILRGMSEGSRKFNWVTTERESAIDDLQRWTFDVAKRYGRKTPLQIVGDEWERVSPETNAKTHVGRDATWKVVKEGQKRNIKGIFITQDPTTISKRVVRQTEYMAVFRNHFTQEDSLYGLNLPFHETQRLPEYHALILDAGGNPIGPPVAADAKYA